LGEVPPVFLLGDGDKEKLEFGEIFGVEPGDTDI